MESMLFRTGSGSIPVQSPRLPASPRPSVAVSGVFEKSGASSHSPRISLHVEVVSRRSISRSFSESDVIRSEARALSKLGSRSFAATKIREAGFVEGTNAGGWPENGISTWEEMGFPAGGSGMNKNRGSDGGGDGGADRRKIGDYYKEMLKSEPMNSLLLRNYGKYLYEVERDVVKAEEYYGRAILASPGDGEVLSLYGKLIWETQRDESRAKSYFNQALQASPHDCTVLGSYAHFLWESEEEEQDDNKDEGHQEIVERESNAAYVAAMVEAF